VPARSEISPCAFREGGEIVGEDTRCDNSWNDNDTELHLPAQGGDLHLITAEKVQDPLLVLASKVYW